MESSTDRIDTVSHTLIPGHVDDLMVSASLLQFFAGILRGEIALDSEENVLAEHVKSYADVCHSVDIALLNLIETFYGPEVANVLERLTGMDATEVRS